MVEVYLKKKQIRNIVDETTDPHQFHHPCGTQLLIDRRSPNSPNQNNTGDSLIKHIISTKFNVEADAISLFSDADGKPYCKEYPSFQFNISHSGEWEACAHDDEPVGIDIQRKMLIPTKRMDLIVSRFFHPVERYRYSTLRNNEKPAFFFTQWGIKESYTKLTGVGFKKPFQGFFAFLDKYGRGFIPDKGRSYYFRQYNIDSDYILIVCSTNDAFPSNIKIN